MLIVGIVAILLLASLLDTEEKPSPPTHLPPTPPSASATIPDDNPPMPSASQSVLGYIDGALEAVQFSLERARDESIDEFATRISGIKNSRNLQDASAMMREHNNLAHAARSHAENIYNLSDRNAADRD